MAQNDLFGMLGDALKQVAPEVLARVNDDADRTDAASKSQASAHDDSHAASPFDALNAAARSLNLENGFDLESLAKFLPKGLDLAAIKRIVEKTDLDALKGFLPDNLDPAALKSALAAFSGGNAHAQNEPAVPTKGCADGDGSEADSPLEALAKDAISAFFGKK